MAASAPHPAADRHFRVSHAAVYYLLERSIAFREISTPEAPTAKTTVRLVHPTPQTGQRAQSTRGVQVDTFCHHNTASRQHAIATQCINTPSHTGDMSTAVRQGAARAHQLARRDRTDAAAGAASGLPPVQPASCLRGGGGTTRRSRGWSICSALTAASDLRQPQLTGIPAAASRVASVAQSPRKPLHSLPIYAPHWTVAPARTSDSYQFPGSSLAWGVQC
jgi:hypothetical protein